MPLSDKIGTHPGDGWQDVGEDDQHYSYNGKILCTGKATPTDAKQDNDPKIHCQDCFVKTRLLFNTDDEKILFEKKSSD